MTKRATDLMPILTEQRAELRCLIWTAIVEEQKSKSRDEGRLKLLQQLNTKFQKQNVL